MSIHHRLALELSRYLEEARILEWMTVWKTTKNQKDHRKGTILSYYNVSTYDKENPNITD